MTRFALTALLILSGSVAAAQDASRRERRELAFSIAGEPRSLDPSGVESAVVDGLIMGALFEGLTVLRPGEVSVAPGVAERWEIGDEGRSLVFHLRRDALWLRDGKPSRAVVAEDFIASWERLLDPERGSAYAFALRPIRGAEAFEEREANRFQAFLAAYRRRDPKVQSWTDIPEAVRRVYRALRRRDFRASVGVRALDDRTLKVELADFTPYFLAITALPYLAPVAEEGEAALANPRAGGLMTNGPFVVDRWRAGAGLSLRRSPRYWDRAAVGLERVEMRFDEDQDRILNRYLAGEEDWVTWLPTPRVRDLLERRDFYSGPLLSSYYYLVNVREAPFKGARGLKVRRALFLAIDRRGLVEANGFDQDPASSIVPPLGGSRGKKDDGRPQREKARALLAEAGYPDGYGFPKVTLLFNKGDWHRLIAERLRRDWKLFLGIEVSLVEKSWGDYLEDRRQGRFDLARMGWIGDYPDPLTFLELMTRDAPLNSTGWSDPRYDRLIAAARGLLRTLDDPKLRAGLVEDLPEQAAAIAALSKETDPAKKLEGLTALRLAALRRCEALLVEQRPILPLYYYTNNQLWRPGLAGLESNALMVHSPKFWRWASAAKRRAY